MRLNKEISSGNKIAIVANRAPISLVERGRSIIVEKSIGGLAAALEPVIEEFNGSWFCTSQEPAELEEYSTHNLPYQLHCLKLSKKEHECYYEGYANKQLWPIFHYFPSRCIFNDEDWFIYKSVNEKMANLVLEKIDDSYIIWIHDYHFLLLPNILRRKNPNLKIGFFLHTPFPNQEVFRLLGNRSELIEGLLGADLIGFHTKQYVEHFVNCVKVLHPYIKIDENKILFNNRKVFVKNFPISIDFEYISQKASSEEFIKKVGKLKSDYNSEFIGISVDRLDYTKGTIERLLAIEHFFEKYPEYIKRITFIQISVPTRIEIETYQKLQRKVDETVGRINGKFSKDGWRPIFYINRSLPFEELITHYSLSDLALVVPLRDGMNLVSKEYIASKVSGKGVLILSEFAGAAEELSNSILVNPYQKGIVAKAIRDGLEMEQEEKTSRMHSLREKIKEYDVYTWSNNYFQAFNEAIKANKQTAKVH